MNKSVGEIEQAAIARIALLIGEFGDLYTARTGGNNAGALDGIEEDWAKLQEQTEEVYRQMISELTDAIDERDMIAQKKTNGMHRVSN